MIYLIEGVPGSGKSYYGTSNHLIPSFKKGMNIFTNIAGLKPLNICALYNVPTDYVENIHFKDPADIDGVRGFFSYNTPSNSLIIVDELQNYYNSRDFKEPHARAVIDYLTQHRHYGHTIVGITQNIDSVDITFRRNAAQVCRLTNMGFIGLQGKAKVHFFESSDTTRSPIATSIISYDLKVFRCYESVEQGANVVHTKFIFPKKLILVAAALIFFIFALNGLMGLTKKQGAAFDHIEKPIPRVEKTEQQKTKQSEGGVICFGGKCEKR